MSDLTLGAVVGALIMLASILAFGRSLLTFVVAILVIVLVVALVQIARRRGRL